MPASSEVIFDRERMFSGTSSTENPAAAAAGAEVFTGFMDDDLAEKFVQKERNTREGSKVKSGPIKSLIQGKSQGGQIYDLDQSELIKLSFEKNLNPHSGEDQTQLGFVWARMPTLTKWKRYIARYKDGNLLFCKDIKTNEFSYCYALFDCQFQAMCISIPERARYEREQMPQFGQSNQES